MYFISSRGSCTNRDRTWNESSIIRLISTSFPPSLDRFSSPWPRRLRLQIQTLLSHKYMINTSTLLSQKKTCLVVNYTVSILHSILLQSPILSSRIQSIVLWAVYFLSRWHWVFLFWLDGAAYSVRRHADYTVSKRKCSGNDFPTTRPKVTRSLHQLTWYAKQSIFNTLSREARYQCVSPDYADNSLDHSRS